MSLSAAEVVALGALIQQGQAIPAPMLLNLAALLQDKFHLLNTRKVGFKLMAAAARNRQQLPDAVFTTMLQVACDASEDATLQKMAMFVLMTSLADGYKQATLALTCQEQLYLGLSHLLHNSPDLAIRSYVACALPHVMIQDTAQPEFLMFYLEDALADPITQSYAEVARDFLAIARPIAEDASDAASEADAEEETEPLVHQAKSLDVLLDEIETLNLTVPAEHKQLLRAQFETIQTASQQPSLLLPESPSKIAKWDLSTCATWAKQIRSNPQKACDPMFLPEMIAVLCRTRKLVKNQTPRNIQILALLMLLDGKEKGRIAEIATGEGKTLLIALFAAYYALQGRKIDIISSSGVLAHRDAESERPFYAALGVTVSDTEEFAHCAAHLTKTKACYLADVVYGDVAFEWDTLHTEYHGSETRGNRPNDIVMVDEVDNLLIDEGAKLALLGGCQPDMEQLQPLLIALWTKLQYENTAEHFIEKNGQLFWQANQESAPIEISTRISCLEQILETHATALISDPDSPILIPQHLKSFALAQAKYWAQSAVMAHAQVQLDQDYVLSQDEDGNTTIAPVDFKNNGVTQLRSAWTNGLHQFLQIKHGLALTPETLTTSFISNRCYFSRYGTRLFGVSGTLGGLDSQSLLTEVYPVDLMFFPTFKTKQLQEIPGILAENDEQWLRAIVETVKAEVSSERAVLVICETNLLVATVENVLAAEGLTRRRRYARSDLADQVAAPAAPMDAGEVMVATALGARGTDIRLTAAVKQKHGLHVCLTYLPNKRGRDQAFGRAARDGEEGSAQLVINQQAIRAQLSPYHFLLGDADTLEAAIAWRDKVEEIRLEDIKQFEFKRIGIQERLFQRFSQLRSHFRKTENNPYRLADLEERWGFWLKKIDNHMRITAHLDDAAIVQSYDTFEQEASSAYLVCKLQNPGYWIKEGNRLSGFGDGQAMLAYQAASELDPIFAFPSYYEQARHNISWHAEGDYGYKQDAVTHLKKAREQIQTHLVPQIQASQLMYAATLKPGTHPKTALLKQYQDKERLLQNILENIEGSIAVIEHASGHVRIGYCQALSQLFSVDPPNTEIAALCRMGLTHLVSYEEVPEEEDEGFFDAFLCAVAGIAQIIVGVCLTLSGMVALGGFFISEGLSDVIYTAHAVMAGHFDWKGYGLHKQVSIAVSAVCWGVDAIKASVAANTGRQVAATTAAKQMSREALVDLAKTQVTRAVISAGIHETANLILTAASRETLAQLKQEIGAHVHGCINGAMQDPALQEAMYTLFSLDDQNHNQRYESQMQQMVVSLLTTQQSRLKSMVSSVIDGVLKKQCYPLSVLKTVHDAADVLANLSDFCDQLCDAFKHRVRFLAHKSAAGQAVVVAKTYCQSRTDAFAASMVSHVKQYITRALHQGVVRPIYGTVMEKKISEFSETVQNAIHQTKVSMPAVRPDPDPEAALEPQKIKRNYITKLSKSRALSLKKKADAREQLRIGSQNMLREIFGVSSAYAVPSNRSRMNSDEADLDLTASDGLFPGFSLIFLGGDKALTHSHVRLLYRGDARPPETIFKQGFKPLGKNPDVLSHVLHNDGQFVSTSLSKSAAKIFPLKVRNGTTYVYAINAQKNAISVPDILKPARKAGLITELQYKYAKKLEMAVPQQINPKDVLGAWSVARSYARNKQAGRIITKCVLPESFVMNPDYVSSLVRLPAQPTPLLHTMRGVTHGVSLIGMTLDGLSLYDAYQYSHVSGNYHEVFRESARVMGAWGGAFATGTAFAKAGVTACAPFLPYGPPVCGLIAGTAGSILGYMGGGYLGTTSYDAQQWAHLSPALPGYGELTYDEKELLDHTLSDGFKKIGQMFLNDMNAITHSSTAFSLATLNTKEVTHAHRQFLYRGDGRHFKSIFEHGFTAPGNNPDIAQHIITPETSQYVATSSTQGDAVAFPADQRKYAYLYEINAQKNAIDVRDFLQKELLSSRMKRNHIMTNVFESFLHEKEWLVSKKIMPRDIRGAWLLEVDQGGYDDISGRRISKPFISNPNYVPSRQTLPLTPSLGLKFAHRLTTGATLIGAGLDAKHLHDAYQRSQALDDDYHEVFRESARVMGAWGGAFATGTAFAKAGVTTCAPFLPYGPPVCGLIAGAAGSMLGYMGGGYLGVTSYDGQQQLLHISPEPPGYGGLTYDEKELLDRTLSDGLKNMEQSVATAAVRGAWKGFKSFLDATCSTALIPYDAAVIAASSQAKHSVPIDEFHQLIHNNPEIAEAASARMRERRDAMVMLGTAVGSLLYDTAIITAAHGLHHPSMDVAKARMNARGKAIKTLATTFSHKSTADQTETAAEIIANIWAPGKLFGLIGGVIKNVQVFDMPLPPRFHSGVPGGKWAQRPVEILSMQQVRALEGEHLLMYVINENRQLIITKKGYEHGWHLGKDKPAFGAGEIYVKNGRAQWINNQSGSYGPVGSHLPDLVETAFIKNGFVEAGGKFVDFQVQWAQALGIPSSTIPGVLRAPGVTSRFERAYSPSGLMVGALQLVSNRYLDTPLSPTASAYGTVATQRQSRFFTSEKSRLPESFVFEPETVVSRCISDQTCKLLQVVPPEKATRTRRFKFKLLVKNKKDSVVDVDLLRELTPGIQDMKSLVICRESINASSCKPVDLPNIVTTNIIRYLKDNSSGSSFMCRDFATHGVGHTADEMLDNFYIPSEYHQISPGSVVALWTKPSEKSINYNHFAIYLYDDVYLSKFDYDELAITTLKEMHDKYGTTDIAVLLSTTPDIKQLRKKTDWNPRYGFFCKLAPSEPDEKRTSPDRPCVK